MVHQEQIVIYAAAIDTHDEDPTLGKGHIGTAQVTHQARSNAGKLIIHYT